MLNMDMNRLQYHEDGVAYVLNPHQMKWLKSLDIADKTPGEYYDKMSKEEKDRFIVYSLWIESIDHERWVQPSVRKEYNFARCVYILILASLQNDT